MATLWRGLEDEGKGCNMKRGFLVRFPEGGAVGWRVRSVLALCVAAAPIGAVWAQGVPTPHSQPFSPVQPLSYGQPGTAKPSSQAVRAASPLERPRGTDEFYGGVMLGGASMSEEKLKPTVDLGDPAKQGVYQKDADSRYLARIEGVAGWGPIVYSGVSLLTHYRYLQDWWSDPGQMSRFSSEWISNPKADTFAFPTKSMIRRHELASDMRYSEPSPVLGFQVNFGAQAYLAWARTGSKLLGEKLEVAETSYAEEGLSPYFLIRYGQQYRGQFMMPFRTVVNKENIDESFATYSWSAKGRGRLFSFVLNNEIPLRGIDSVLFFDFRLYQYKYSSLTFDRNQPSFSVALDFPIFGTLRLRGMGAYEIDRFYLPKVRIPGMHAKEGDGAGPNASEDMEEAQDFDRRDTKYSGGSRAYFDFGEKLAHRIFVDFSMMKSFSTVAEYSAGKMSLLVGYRWALPSAAQVERRVDRFQEGTYAGDF